MYPFTVPKNPLILVADDDKATRIFLRLILQKENYKIIEATTGLDCLEKYQENPPDMVLLDALMPVMDGFTCCQKLIEIQNQEAELSNFYQVPILMITGLNDRDSVNKAFEAGAIDYITKPIHPNVLSRRLKYLLEAKWAEAKVRESEQKYRLVTNNLREGIFRLNTFGNLTFLNLAWKNIIGFSIEESLDQPLAKFIHPKDTKIYKSAMRSLLNKEKNELSLSVRFVKSDCQIGWMEIDARLMMLEDNYNSQYNEIIGISGTINDVTEKKKRQAYQQVEYEINKILADISENNNFICKILAIICKYLEWDMGEYWVLDSDLEALKLDIAWHISIEDFKHFIDVSSQINHEIGEGLPGRIWQYNSTTWIDDFDRNETFIRSKLADNMGFKTALGFLISNGSEKLGVICLLCREKKQIDSDFINLTKIIGNQIGQFIKHQKAEAELQKQHLILKSELNQAAKYVTSLLPNADLIETIDIQQLFIPSIQLGGDIFDYYWLDSENFAIYLLDVAGHGVRPALLSVSVLNLLRSQSLYNADFYQPWTVITELNRLFPMDDKGENYFTIWYGVYNIESQKLSYCSAAHPPALLLNSNSSELTIQELANDNIAVGMLPEFEFEQASCSVSCGSSLYIFSDGIYEIPLDDENFWGFKAFAEYIQNYHCRDTNDLNSILNDVQQLNSAATLGDDVSLIRFKFL